MMLSSQEGRKTDTTKLWRGSGELERLEDRLACGGNPISQRREGGVAESLEDGLDLGANEGLHGEAGFEPEVDELVGEHGSHVGGAGGSSSGQREVEVHASDGRGADLVT